MQVFYDLLMVFRFRIGVMWQMKRLDTPEGVVFFPRSAVRQFSDTLSPAWCVVRVRLLVLHALSRKVA